MTDDLTTIPGVGETIAANLRDVGFETAEEVLEADVDELTEADRVGESSAKAIVNGETSGYNGRPTKLDDVYDDVMEAAERGLTYEGIARVAGIGLATLDDWRDQYDEFAEELEQHRSVGEQKLVERVAEKKPEFILERSYDYIKTEKHEVDADVDQTTTHDVTAEFVTYSSDEDDGDE